MNIEEEIKALKERNRRVEADKAWEKSWTRRLSIMAITYGAACLFLIAIGAGNPFLSALVPMFGFLLSTLSLPLIKKGWLKRQA